MENIVCDKLPATSSACTNCCNIPTLTGIVVVEEEEEEEEVVVVVACADACKRS